MVVTVRVSDDTYSAYQKMNPQAPAKAMEAQLDRFASVTPADRALFLSQAERKEVEQLLESTFVDGADLVKRIKRMVSIEVAGEPVVLSEGQRKRLSDEARYWTKDPGKHAKERVSRLLFEGLGA